MYYNIPKNSLECERLSDPVDRGLNEAEYTFMVSVKGKLFSGYSEKHFCEQRSLLHLYEYNKPMAQPFKIEID